MASEHILLSTDKYDRLMRRLKEWESRDPATEQTGSHSDNDPDRVDGDMTVDASSSKSISSDTSLLSSSSSNKSSSDTSTISSSNEQANSQHKQSEPEKPEKSQVKSASGTREEDRDSGNAAAGEIVTNKERIITKRDLMEKLGPPPGKIASREGKRSSQYTKSTKGPSKLNKGNKKRKWETL